tara:strand:- start:290 stop:715 length:426 start_codon:yes stop_codon:yes gene_type:complete
LNIKIGDKYQLSTLNKKSFIDIETFSNAANIKVIIHTFFRSCIFDLTINSKEEIDELSKLINDDSDDYTGLENFSDVVFNESLDEYARDIFVEAPNDLKNQEETIYENVLQEGVDWLDDNGFVTEEISYKLKLPLQITPVL